MKNSVYKNKGGKYTSAPARAVAFFASQKQGEVNMPLLLRGQSHFLLRKNNEANIPLLLQGQSHFLLRKKQGGIYAG